MPVRVLDFESLEVVQEIMDCDECVSAVKYSPDGKYLAAGSWDQKLYLYDVEKEYKLMYVLTGNSSSVEHVMFTADSRVVMTNSKDTQSTQAHNSRYQKGFKMASKKQVYQAPQKEHETLVYL